MMLWQEWWVWASVALVLVIIEVMMVPGYVFLGFAAGAAIMALLMAFSVVVPGLPTLLVVFGVLSAVSIWAMRHYLPGSRGDVKLWKRDIND